MAASPWRPLGGHLAPLLSAGPPEKDDPAHEPRTQHIGQGSSPTNLWDNYNTFRIEFWPDRLRFLLNGAVVREERDTSEFSKFLVPGNPEPMNIRLTLWAGFSEWSGQVRWAGAGAGRAGPAAPGLRREGGCLCW